MKRGLLLLTGVIFLTAGAPGPVSEDERLGKFVQYFLQKRISRARVSRPAEIQRVAFFDRILDRIDPEKLSIDGKIDLDLLRLQVRKKIDQFALRHTTFPKSAAMIPPRDFVDMTTTLLTEKEQTRTWMQAGRAVEGAPSLPDWLKSSLKRGIAKAHEEIALASAMRGKDTADLASLLKDFKEHLSKVDDPDPPKRAASKHETYQFRIRYTLLSDHTPESLLELGMSMYRDTVRRMQKVARAIDPDRTLDELITECKKDGWAAEDIHKNAERLSHEARDFALKKDLVTIPDEAREFSVIRGAKGLITPFGHYRFGVGRRGSYVTPPVEGLNENDLRERILDNNKYWTKIVALHEAVPGHHLQMNVARNLKRNPIRTMSNTAAYVEGWGLYSEEMMFRAGYYSDNSKQRLIALQMRLWRCARVIIDVGIQTGAITKEEAVDLMVDGVRMSRSCATLEVNHYERRPTYFCGYLLGYLAFTKLRAECEEIMGDRFDAKTYHDFLLNLGPMPLRSLRKAVLHWAEK